MSQRTSQRRLLLGAATGLLIAVAAIVTIHERADAPAAERPAGPAGPAASEPEVHRIGDLDNVSAGLAALGAVWVVTSDLPDAFSPGPVAAAVHRVDPDTRRAERVLDVPSREPSLTVLGDRVWVDLADRMVALDAAGTVVAAVPLAPVVPGDHVAGGGRLWVLDRVDDRIAVVDPLTSSVVDTFATGASPVGPISAFGRIWIPSITDGTVTVITHDTTGARPATVPVPTASLLTDVTAVPGAASGDEVWVTTIDGDLFAISAEPDTFGEVRPIAVEPSINRIHADGDRAFLLPTFGLDVLTLDLASERVETRIRLGSIPFRAVLDHGVLWVAQDGRAEALSAIDTTTSEILATYEVGTRRSQTTGPREPFVVGDEIWVPNRGDDAVFVVAIDRANGP